MTDAKKTAGPRGSDKSGREDSKATPPEDEVEIIDNGADADDTEAIEVEPEERIHALDEEVDEFAEQNTMLLDSLKRLKADFDNYRKRMPVSYTHLRAHETRHDLVCRLLLEKKK